ncbi:MAG TPA: hypothetical protein VFI46_16675 [Jiangellaceae bacterium]|nr:hypothetical protein [Jiangellaceae bacterium]
MTAGRYRIAITGRIGPAIRSAFAELVSEEVQRHHVLLVREDRPDALTSVLDRLDGWGVDVDRVTARYC